MITMILAGGGGTRLWPFSRSQNPKQFLNLGSTDSSLLQDTYTRLNHLSSTDQTYVIGAADHEFEIKRHMEQLDPGFSSKNFLLEPASRNTAPAILWGLFQLPESEHQETVLILPADHLIQKPDAFIQAIKEAESLAQKEWLVTFGIEPSRPDTGYGYIQAGEKLDVGYQVQRFVEKPDEATAKKYLEQGNYTWNAGIFMGRVDVFLSEFQTHAPELYSVFEAAKKAGKDLRAPEVVQEMYQQLVSDSVDYALFEKSKKVAVLPVEMAWSDLGSWDSIYQVSPKDENGNVIRGNVMVEDTENSLIFSSKKLVTSVGVKNLAIIETDDALLVSDLSQTQDVKKLVQTLKNAKRDEVAYHSKVHRPWGSYTNLFETNGYKLKILEVLPGKRLSLQRHRHRSEHWLVVHGSATVQCDQDVILLSEGESIDIPQTAMHRLANDGKLPLQVLETQQGDYLEEDDIERFEDDFGRIPDES